MSESAGPVPFLEGVRLKRAILIGLAALLVGLLALPAMADTAAQEKFEGFTAQTSLTSANAEANGWSYTGAVPYDIGTVANGIDGQSLRISNAVMDFSFGDWLFSKRLDVPVTEAGGQEFVAEYQIKSATGAYQPGLQVSVAPQSLDGARMSYLRFEDTPLGIDVFFVDNPNGSAQRQVQVADNLSWTGTHNIRIVLDLYEGPHNDVAQVFIDGSEGLVPPVASIEGFYAPVDHPDIVNKAKAGQTIPLKFKLTAEPATTWEDYYRFNGESNDGIPQEQWTTRGVDSLIFQGRGSGTNEAVEGNGFLFDNVELTGSGNTTLPTGAAGDASILGPHPFTADSIACDLGADIDPIEVYTPGASGLTYNATTGMWHYNWQTPKSLAGSCVNMTLNLTGDYALFRFTK